MQEANNAISCIDPNAIAFIIDCMSKKLLSELEGFMAETGLSAHRVGLLCASNGRLIERLRNGGRVWPETEQDVRAGIARERARRAKREIARGNA